MIIGAGWNSILLSPCLVVAISHPVTVSRVAVANHCHLSCKPITAHEPAYVIMTRFIIPNRQFFYSAHLPLVPG